MPSYCLLETSYGLKRSYAGSSGSAISQSGKRMPRWRDRQICRTALRRWVSNIGGRKATDGSPGANDLANRLVPITPARVGRKGLRGEGLQRYFSGCPCHVKSAILSVFQNRKLPMAGSPISDRPLHFPAEPTHTSALIQFPAIDTRQA